MPLFALTIFLGAFLLFQVQPLLGKFILPWYGGSPGVWSTCLLFFQAALLAGYAYAHFALRHFKPRTQAVVHLGLLLAALASLPVTPGAHWQPRSAGEPTWRILAMLGVCTGLPYFVLAASGPLLQAWFSRLPPARPPYRLFALSNLGSLLALVSYPFFFEPGYSRQTQATLWGGGLAVFALLCGGCAVRWWCAHPVLPPSAASAGAPAEADRPLEGGVKILWFSLPACASVLLLATTNKICQDVAVIPFLWVLPLSLYLLTFVFCFDHPRWYPRKLMGGLLAPALGSVCVALFIGRDLPLWAQVGIYAGGLFCCGMVCHGELYRLKPAPSHLTSFYLMIAAGGAAGGGFVALVAPRVFDSFLELNWGLWALPVLLLVVHAREQSVLVLGTRRWLAWPYLLGGAMFLGMVLVVQSWSANANTVAVTRNFYGVLRVCEDPKNEPNQRVLCLQHGEITHGIQVVKAQQPPEPLSYFHTNSGVGLALIHFPRPTNRTFGVVGLGVGTLAAYGQPGDTFRFYELNPAVKQLAEGFFTYLSGSPARIEIVLGDARLSLENGPPQQFDILVLDAFSGDAVPVHLLTREAFALYRRQVKADGVIAVNITNRHLDLFPVVRRLAAQFQWDAVVIKWAGPPPGRWRLPSDWLLLSRNRAFLDCAAIRQAASPMPPAWDQAPLWTDDYASLFHVLK